MEILMPNSGQVVLVCQSYGAISGSNGFRGPRKQAYTKIDRSGSVESSVLFTSPVVPLEHSLRHAQIIRFKTVSDSLKLRLVPCRTKHVER